FMTSLAKRKYRSELRRTDWDFASHNGSDGFSGYHWYPARFVPQLAGTLVNYFSEPGDTVLDPFCGSGTTLVEAYKFGRLSVGIDINPIAALMTRAKVVPFEERSFSQYSAQIMRDARTTLADLKGSLLSRGKRECAVPNYAENKNWYEAD